MPGGSATPQSATKVLGAETAAAMVSHAAIAAPTAKTARGSRASSSAAPRRPEQTVPRFEARLTNDSDVARSSGLLRLAKYPRPNGTAATADESTELGAVPSVGADAHSEGRAVRGTRACLRVCPERGNRCVADHLFSHWPTCPVVGHSVHDERNGRRRHRWLVRNRRTGAWSLATAAGFAGVEPIPIASPFTRCTPFDRSGRPDGSRQAS